MKTLINKCKWIQKRQLFCPVFDCDCDFFQNEVKTSKYL